MGGEQSQIDDTPLEQYLSQINEHGISKEEDFYSEISKISVERKYGIPISQEFFNKLNTETIRVIAMYIVEYFETFVEKTCVTRNDVMIYTQLCTMSIKKLNDEELMKKYLTSLAKIVFYPKVTLEPESTTWDSFVFGFFHTRFDILKAILSLCPKTISDFPISQFLRSTFSLVDSYIHEKTPRNLAFLDACFSTISCIGMTSPDAFLDARNLCKKDAILPMLDDDKYIPFIYLCFLYDPKFSSQVSRIRRNLLSSLISNYQVFLESQKHSVFLFEIIASLVSLLLSEDDCSSILSAPCDAVFNTKFRPFPGTFADVLIQTFMQTPSSTFISLVDQILTATVEIDIKTCIKLGNLFESVSTRSYATNFADVLAKVVSRSEVHVNMKTIILEKYKIIKSVASPWAKSTLSTFASAFASKVGKKRVTSSQAAAIISELDIFFEGEPDNWVSIVGESPHWYKYVSGICKQCLENPHSWEV